MKFSGFDKASLCNVVLLGLFALGLGLSSLIVHFRTTIVLSEPVELPGEGLSVTVPIGTGWESLTEWTYERDNSFTLVSVFRVQGPPIAEVRWQVRLAERPLSAEELLQYYAGRFPGQAGEIQFFDSSVPFTWMHLFPRISNEELLLAVSVLEGSRVLLLQLRCYAEPLYNISKLFEYLAASVQVHADPRRTQGTKLVNDSTDRFYHNWREDLTDQPMAFLIRSANGSLIGYRKISAVPLNSSDSLQTGLYYEEVFGGNSGSSKMTSQFQAAEDLSEFVWTSTQIIRRKANRTILQRQNDGALKIQDPYGRQDTYWPAPGAAPEILMPVLTRVLLDTSESEVIIDVISSNGSIVPTVLSKMNLPAVSEKAESIQYAVKVDFLHEADNYEEYYFDQEMNLIGKYENFPAQTPRLWDRVTEKDLLIHFGTQEKSVKQFLTSESILSFYSE